MENKKIAGGLVFLSAFCTLSLSASEQATTNTETSKIAPQIFQKVGAYWKFMDPENNNDVSKKKVEALITKNKIDALELENCSEWHLSFFQSPAKNIKKILVHGTMLWSDNLQKLAQLFPNTVERAFDIEELELTEKEDDKTVQKILNECTDKLIKLRLYNKNLTLSWVDKLKCKKLQQLSLCEMELSNKKLQCILDNCPELQKVILCHIKGLDGLVSWKNQPQLSCLMVEGSEVPATFLEDVLKNCPHLKSLVLFGISGKLTEINWSKQLNLEYLALNKAQLSLAVLLTMIDTFPNLKYLKFFESTYKSQKQIQNLRKQVVNQIALLPKLFTESSADFASSLLVQNDLSLDYLREHLSITIPPQKGEKKHKVDSDSSSEYDDELYAKYNGSGDEY